MICWHRFYALYEPETGRYISANPIGLAGGMTLYAYVVAYMVVTAATQSLSDVSIPELDDPFEITKPKHHPVLKPFYR